MQLHSTTSRTKLHTAKPHFHLQENGTGNDGGWLFHPGVDGCSAGAGVLPNVCVGSVGWGEPVEVGVNLGGDDV